MKKRILIIGFICLGLILISYFILFQNNHSKKYNQDITIVPTLLDDVISDTAWCGSFQLVWNDMKNEVVKQDIEFSPQEKMAENLNKEEFNENMISSKYYYKKYGLKSLELKKEIEQSIKDKFNQTSDILNDFNWDQDNLNNENNMNVKRYFFYSMLYREFEYKYKFKKMGKSTFGKYKNIKYFGISKNAKSNVRSQLEILFYNNSDDFAVSIATKDGDSVIFYKNPKGSTFKGIYNNMISESKKYTGNHKFTSEDSFKAPFMEFDIKKEYIELANKPFIAFDGDTCIIEKAIQSISFKMDEAGGKIKSESAIDMTKTTSAIHEVSRNLDVNDVFTLFIKEKGKDVPYFALKVENIEKYQ